jgi:cytoskeletal protein CcmA (bactofilin family)
MFGFGKKKKRRATDNIVTYTTEIGPDAVFEGKLQGEGNYSIHGKVVGESDISGILLLETEGEWVGNVLADVVIIAGTVKGSVMAREKLELRVGGRVQGDLEAPVIAIAEGAVYDGKIKMAKAANITRYKERRGVEAEEN